MRIDSFKEIAEFCVNRYKESFDANNKNNIYVDTLYVAIDKFGYLTCSTTPHVLHEACECLLIHRRRSLAITNSYDWYKIEYVDEEGAVTNGVLKNGFTLWTGAGGSYSNQIIQLQNGSRIFYTCFWPFETNLQHLWDAYCRLKKAKSDAEIEFIDELIEKDEKILELEKEIDGFSFTKHLLKLERDQYKELLDEIKEAIKEQK